MKKGYKQLVDEASAEIKTYSVAEALAKMHEPHVQFIDVRDIRELERDELHMWFMHLCQCFCHAISLDLCAGFVD